ncbi:MAG: cytidine deaminase [Oscillospiraceae bacterium]|nr:cytidine deaminase [Oscillospiraceae bacterium]
MLTNSQKNELIRAAVEVRDWAYVPYSRFKVGAALLSKTGRVFTGCNFENASFGAGVCAERVALGNAISAGETEFVAIAVCGDDKPTPPCGICRQSLVEFGEIIVYCADSIGEKVTEFTLRELLPVSFEFASKNP